MSVSVHDHHRVPRRSLKLLVMVALVVVPVGRLARADELATAPMPPVPEDVRGPSPVQPVSLEVATPLPLDASGETSLTGTGATGTSSRRANANPMGNWSVLAALGAAFVVLAAFRYWQTRRSPRSLPSDVFEVLGEATLGGPHAVRVVRFGPRTLLVSLSAAGCQTLATLDDPLATERIVSACAGSRTPKSIRPMARPAQASVSREER